MGLVLDSTFDRLANAVQRFAKFGLSNWFDIACCVKFRINNMFAFLQAVGQQGQLVAKTVFSSDAGLRLTSTLRPCLCLRSCPRWVFKLDFIPDFLANVPVSCLLHSQGGSIRQFYNYMQRTTGLF